MMMMMLLLLSPEDPSTRMKQIRFRELVVTVHTQFTQLGCLTPCLTAVSVVEWVRV